MTPRPLSPRDGVQRGLVHKAAGQGFARLCSRLCTRLWPWPTQASLDRRAHEARRVLEAWISLQPPGPDSDRLWMFGWGDRRSMQAWTDGRGGHRLLLWKDNAPYTALPRWLVLRVEAALTVDGRFAVPKCLIAIEPRALSRSAHAHLQAWALLDPPAEAFRPLPPESPDVCG